MQSGWQQWEAVGARPTWTPPHSPRDQQPRFGGSSGAADLLGSEEQGAGRPRAEPKWLVCFCRNFPVSPKMGLRRTLPMSHRPRWPSPEVQGAGHCPARREGRGSGREAQAGRLLSHHFGWIPARDGPEPRTWPWGLEETGRQAGARPQVVRVLRGRPPLPSRPHLQLPRAEAGALGTSLVVSNGSPSSGRDD